MPMIRYVTPRQFRHLLYVTTIALTFGPCSLSASAQQAATKHIPAKLICGPHSANPKELKAFVENLQFDVTGNLWTSERKTGPQPGQERFLGILSPSSGTMLVIGERRLVVGEGKLDDRPIWTYEFSGRKSPSGLTILRGGLQSQVPKGTRSCSLGF
jgi:hypothetical protein